MALEFARAGHKVMATARNRETLDDLVDERLCAQALDVTDSESIPTAAGACLEWGGRIDVVINNAGYAVIGPLSEIDLAELRAQLETNVVGLVAVTKVVVPHMVARRSGRIVNIGSVSGVTTTPCGGAYSASKAVVHMVSDALRMELASFGIEVITVQPGSIESSFGTRASSGLERFREGSLYASVSDHIEAGAMASQQGAMSSSELAKLIVGAVTEAKPSATLRAGKNSFLLPALARLPVELRDRFLSRKFGLDALTPKKTPGPPGGPGVSRQ